MVKLLVVNSYKKHTYLEVYCSVDETLLSLEMSILKIFF